MRERNFLQRFPFEYETIENEKQRLGIDVAAHFTTIYCTMKHAPQLKTFKTFHVSFPRPKNNY